MIDLPVDTVECDIANRPIWQNAKILRVDTVCLQLQMNNTNEEAVAQILLMTKALMGDSNLL